MGKCISSPEKREARHPPSQQDLNVSQTAGIVSPSTVDLNVGQPSTPKIKDDLTCQAVSDSDQINEEDLSYTTDDKLEAEDETSNNVEEDIAAEESVSGSLRKEGNKHYVSATTDLAPTVRMDRFQKALKCYEDAFSSAKTDDEISSASKNIATTAWKMARLSSEQSESWVVIKFHYKHSLKNFYIAFTRGELGHKLPSWMDGILASSRGCFEEFLTLSESRYNLNEHERIITVREMVEYIPCAVMKADCMIEIAKYHFERGLVNISNGDFRGCLNHMRECYFPMNEALRFGSGVQSVEREYGGLEADVNMQTALAMAIQSQETGDGLFTSVLQDEELLNMDMVWEVIDWYKDSIIKVHNLDIKQEAKSLSRIGVVYDKVLKIKFRAKVYLKKSMELAHAITPFNVSNEKWYKDCREILDRYQKESLVTEQEEDRKKKAAVLEELKPELDELKKQEDDTYEKYLEFLYKRFPPKNPAHELNLTKKEGDDDFTLKYRALQKAVIHYHPDRVDEDVHGLKEKVLFEEITKCLTERYEQVKSTK